jgi:GAF domain-containing protein
MGDGAATVEQLRVELRRRDAELREARAEIERRNRELAESLEQQTATAEVLRVIATSPADLPSVLDAIVGSAAKLFGADRASIQQADAERLRIVADTDPQRVGSEWPYDRDTVNGRAMLDAETLHAYRREAEDLAAFPKSRMHEEGFAVQLSTPLLRRGTPIGTLGVGRRAPLPFTDQQIALLETFADQAVIAIENARLFQELEQRNAELQEGINRLDSSTAGPGYWDA